MEAFENVLGYDAVKEELSEILDIMQNKEIYEKLGASCPNGLLLYGNPGVGKTLLANSFIKASGRKAIICKKDVSDKSFIDSINEAFLAAMENEPSIILLDDMDKFSNNDSFHRDSEAFVTVQSCIDTVKDSDVFVIATVNNIKKLPDSLVRTGRFDHKIIVDNPTKKDSQKIIEHYLSNKGLADNIDIRALATIFSGSSCAMIESVINQAAIIAGHKHAEHASMRDMIQAYLQIKHGIPKRSLEPNEKLNLYTTNGDADAIWHEAGHVAISEILSPGSVTLAIATPEQVAKHSFTVLNPDDVDMHRLAKSKTNIMVALGGMAAIDIVFGKVDIGASSDVEDVLRTINNIQDLGGFSGLSLATDDQYGASSNMEQLRETSRYTIAELYLQETKELLCKNRLFLDAIAEAFAKKVILTANDIDQIRQKLNRATYGMAA